MVKKNITEGDLQEESNLRDTAEERLAIQGEYVEGNTLIILKPEALIRGLAGLILTRLEDKGLRIVKLTMRTLNREILERHYEHISQKPFFNDIVNLMTRGPVIIAIVRGHLAIQTVRNLIGPTDPALAPGGTIRGDFATSLEEGNLIHASDSREAYLRELSIFFPELTLQS